MRIFTTNALKSDTKTESLTDWPGLQALVVLPGSELAERDSPALCDTMIVEWLEPPENTAVLLRDVLNWLRYRLQDDEGPFLYINAPIWEEDSALVPNAVSPYEVHSELDSEGHVTRLVLGEMIATSPLLLEFLQTVEGRNLNDAAMVELLAAILSWGE